VDGGRPEPWARAKQTVDPAVLTWLHSTVDIDRWREVAAQIRCPALLLTGDPSKDEVTVRVEGASEAARLCAALEVVTVPGPGHSIHRDRFDALLAAVQRFLRDLP
jgi:N-formylmaleamate deformylase